MKIPCISVMQPHAQLIALGAKAIETRSRDFTGGYRGPLGIQASKRFPRDNQRLCYTVRAFRSVLEPHLGERIMVPEKTLPLGCIVAVGDLVDVVRIGAMTSDITVPMARHLGYSWLSIYDAACQRELAFGDYTPGRYMYLLKNVVALEKPIPAKGRLGLWSWEAPEDASRLLDGRTHDEMPGMGER